MGVEEAANPPTRHPPGGRIGDGLLTLQIEVRDDGIGGADARAGSGLRGIADRVAALDGTLEVDSPAGGGTVLRARMPYRVPARAPVALVP